jgi:hypothetical protein
VPDVIVIAVVIVIVLVAPREIFFSVVNAE